MVELLFTFFITGGSGNSGNNLNGVLTFDGEEWNEVGQLQMARYRHGATKIKIDAAMNEFYSNSSSCSGQVSSGDCFAMGLGSPSLSLLTTF